jgi:hypothetical protein
LVFKLSDQSTRGKPRGIPVKEKLDNLVKPDPKELFDTLSKLSTQDPESYIVKKLLVQAEVYSTMQDIPLLENVAFKDIWKFVVDGRHWTSGAYIFENEPGCILSLLNGLLYALKTRNEEKTPEWYIKLHDTTVNLVFKDLGWLSVAFAYGSNPIKDKKIYFDNPYLYMGEWDAGRLFQSGCRCDNPYVNYSINNMDRRGTKDFYERDRNGWMHEWGFNRSKSLCPVKWIAEKENGESNKPSYPTRIELRSKTKTELIERMKLLFQGFQQLLADKTLPADQLLAILWLVREMEIHHFFGDGNGRTSTLALLSMTCSTQFSLFPLLCYDDNFLDGTEPERLCLFAVAGMINLIELTTALDNTSNCNFPSLLKVEELKESIITKFRDLDWQEVHDQTGLTDIYPPIHTVTKHKAVTNAALSLEKVKVRHQQEQVPLVTIQPLKNNYTLLLDNLAQNVESGSKPRWTSGGSTSQKVQVLRALQTFVNKQDEKWIIDNQTQLLTLIKSICGTHYNWAPAHFGSPASLGVFLTLVRDAPEQYGTSAEAVNALKTAVLSSEQLSEAIKTDDFNGLLNDMPVEHSSEHKL